MYSKDEGRFTSYKKFQAYTLLCFYVQMNEKWLYGHEEFPGLSRNGALIPTADINKKEIKRNKGLNYSKQNFLNNFA